MRGRPDRVGLAIGGREGGLNESRAGAGLRPPARGGAHPSPSGACSPDLCASALGRTPRPGLAAPAGRSPPPPGPAGTARAAVASFTPSAASRRPGLPLPLPQPALLSSGPCSPFRFFCEGSKPRPFAGPRRLHLESALFPPDPHPGSERVAGSVRGPEAAPGLSLVPLSDRGDFSEGLGW